ncbi:MAG: Luciferase-like [Cyanobacteria bacterium RYN_339]|nr:Luciferase-like [Cyanobacteria bacterium RYN_339]
MRIPLSVLDLVPRGENVASGDAIRDSLALATLVDRLGYTRLWYAEHHNMPNILSTTPEIMIALAGQVTHRIRVGSGGVMLPNHAPFKVAEAFKMLEALYPGRVDLGLGRAPGTDQVTALALRGSRQALETDEFPDKLAQLLAFGRNHMPEGHPFHTVKAEPADGDFPPIWMLGSSDYGARMAAMLGVGFAFAAHFSDLPPEIPLRLYKDQFDGPGAHAILTLAVICAESQEEADRQAASFLVAVAQNLTGKRVQLPSPEVAAQYPFSPRERAIAEGFRARLIAGTPATVRERIEALVDRTGADEVMITTNTYGQAARLRSYELLADAF